MKQLVCEMCGSNDLVKQDGVFVCQSCGCKYSVEEAKKMMVEVSGSVVIENPVEVKGIAQADTMLENAKNTFDQGNYVEAYRLFSDVLSLQPKNPTAIFYRGLSGAYQSTVKAPRYEEATKAASLAIENAVADYPDEKLDAFTTDLLNRLAILTVSIAGLFDGYVKNMDSAVKVYGLTSAIVKADTMNSVAQQSHMQKIMQNINYCTFFNKLRTQVVERMQCYSDAFCAGLIKFVDSGFVLGGEYSINLAEQVGVVVEHLECIKKLNITVDSGSYELEKQLITKCLARPYFGTEEAWVKVSFWAKKYDLSMPAYEKPQTTLNSSSGSNGCYVATCVYGSYDCPQVWTLRRYRDNTLASTWYGRTFIHTYYAISPTLVKWFGHTSWFKNLWRGTLDRMVHTLNAAGVYDTPYQDKTW